MDKESAPCSVKPLPPSLSTSPNLAKTALLLSFLGILFFISFHLVKDFAVKIKIVILQVR